MPQDTVRAEFEGTNGAALAARIDLPDGAIRATALFAHCFTCSKDIIAARTISRRLTGKGIAVMRFDFTGLGQSGGDFGSTNFSMNLGDLKRAAAWLAATYEAPSLLIGHSLGGAAALAVAPDLPSVRAVATINAPSDVSHIAGHFGDQLNAIMANGAADVLLGQRSFRIEKQFIEDLATHSVIEQAAKLKAALLILHTPTDDTVGIDHASALFTAAQHPKSFISLDGANHLLSDPVQADYAADVIAAWASKYLPQASSPLQEADHGSVLVQETREGKYQNRVSMGNHTIMADEPASLGGLDSGPAPYDFLCAALGACTSITMRMYADRKGFDVERIAVTVHHEKRDDPSDERGKVDVFRRTISLHGPLDEATRTRILEIADRCPVHRTLEAASHIETEEE